jgi:hypothetical protein
MVGVRAEADESGSLTPEGCKFRSDLDHVRRLANLLYAAL